MKIGYKGMKSDMTCRGIKFEVGKTYYIDKDKKVRERSNPIDYNRPNERLKLCTNDVIHYCNNLKDVQSYYNLNDERHRFFVVQILGEFIDGEDGKSGTDCIKILRELSREEVETGFIDKLRDDLDDSLKLSDLRAMQEKFPMIIIGGSLSLYLRGYWLERFRACNSDFDIISPYWVDLTEYKDIVDTEDEKNSGNDFDDTFSFRGKKIDLRISPHERYEIITYRGHQYKVGSFINVIEAKARYALQKGGSKHLNDLTELMSKNKLEWI